jgi:hypothetical protein
MRTRSDLFGQSKECLDRLIPLGEHHFRHAVREYVAHYHLKRNHQGLANTLIAGTPARTTGSSVDTKTD